ncbi:MAG TPA: alpha/beta hydrolase [Solirubrobacterales bacterium]|nr:alpha/beta hydrolase [Solirubrobacterales bacterium]
MPEIEVSAGPIEYGDSGGAGRPLVFVGGLPHDESLWDGVVAELAPEFRCLTPVLPLGAQRKPLRPDADLSLPGLGRIVTEFLERLDLRDAVVCFNDWGGAQTMVSHGGVDRVGAFVLISCETDRNYPPGVAGQIAALSGFLPGGFGVMRFALSSPTLRKLPFTYGRMSKRGVPDELMHRWLQPLKRREIRRDTRRYVRDVRHGKREIRAATPQLRSFERPVLVVWDEEGTMMPNSEGRRLAESFPNSTYVELPDCYTLIPIDQPQALAGEIREFARQ